MKRQDIFLIAYYHKKPKDPARTKEPGYMSDLENINYDESINITRGLKTRDQLQSSVVLNLSKQLVVKNGFKSDADFPSLLAHYQEGYPKYINPLLAQLYPEVQNAEHVSSQEEEKGN
jgi:hypothetical protein